MTTSDTESELEYIKARPVLWEMALLKSLKRQSTIENTAWERDWKAAAQKEVKIDMKERKSDALPYPKGDKHYGKVRKPTEFALRDIGLVQCNYAKKFFAKAYQKKFAEVEDYRDSTREARLFIAIARASGGSPEDWPEAYETGEHEKAGKGEKAGENDGGTFENAKNLCDRKTSFPTHIQSPKSFAIMSDLDYIRRRPQLLRLAEELCLYEMTPTQADQWDIEWKNSVKAELDLDIAHGVPDALRDGNRPSALRPAEFNRQDQERFQHEFIKQYLKTSHPKLLEDSRRIQGGTRDTKIGIALVIRLGAITPSIY